MKKKVTITLENDEIKKGMEDAKNNRDSFSSHIGKLIMKHSGKYLLIILVSCILFLCQSCDYIKQKRVDRKDIEFYKCSNLTTYYLNKSYTTLSTDSALFYKDKSFEYMRKMLDKYYEIQDLKGEPSVIFEFPY